MLGMLAATGLLPIPEERILDAILAAALPAFVEINREAFRSGAAAVKEVGTR
jgi:Pyruvate/2-oxoacid:ferredoxin oxidoreductase gamma subunit